MNPSAVGASPKQKLHDAQNIHPDNLADRDVEDDSPDAVRESTWHQVLSKFRIGHPVETQQLSSDLPSARP